MLEKRKEYLENIINKLSKSKLKDKYANQKIHVSTSNGRQQFYLINSKTKARTYLSKEQQEYIHELIQRDYESEVLKSATDELKTINKYPDIRVESIFENIHEAKKKYITVADNGSGINPIKLDYYLNPFFLLILSLLYLFQLLKHLLILPLLDALYEAMLSPSITLLTCCCVLNIHQLL